VLAPVGFVMPMAVGAILMSASTVIVALNAQLLRRTDLDPARLALLTPGELRIATAIGTGSSNAEIAAQLSMSIATIKSYGSRILTKLELNNRVQIALLVHDAGTET
ncbi:LuxR C-terminal-related transcriptional regulator, partial [Streptomyces niveus]